MSASFDYYRTFYYVAKYKNFTRAATMLLSSQPSVTRSIQNLESELPPFYPFPSRRHPDSGGRDALPICCSRL